VYEGKEEDCFWAKKEKSKIELGKNIRSLIGIIQS